MALGLSVVAAGAALVLPDKPVFDLAPLVRRMAGAARPALVVAAAPVGIEGMLRPRPAEVSNGTGFFVTSRGTLLTAEHVVRGLGWFVLGRKVFFF